MKKRLIVLGLAGLTLVFANSVRAQGLVTLTTYFHADSLHGLVYNTDGTTLINGSNFTAELWGGSSTDPNTWTLLRSVVGTADLGVFFDSGSAQVSGVAVGSTAFYEIRVTDTISGATGSSRLDPVNGNFTAPQIASVTTAGPPSTGANTDTFLNFKLTAVVVPEPSTLLLGLMGGVGLLLRRRK